MAGKSEHVPNPKRVAAGRRNRRLRGELTPEGRARLHLAIQRIRPWEHSTGPHTPEGKARVALNGKKSQKGARSLREVRRDLADVRKLVLSMRTVTQMAGGTR